MDLLKQLTGKNPAEYKSAAKILVETPDVALFEKLVKQDEFLFDFVKNNVADRIKNAVTGDNYRNILKFWDYYSPSYENIFAEIIWEYGKENIIDEIKELFLNGNMPQKTYASKYLSLIPNDSLKPLIETIRNYSKSKDDYLASNCIELLSKIGDEISKNNALQDLKSNDEFKAYDAIKFLVTFGAKDSLEEIIDVMKKSSLSENIASEIPYLISPEELLEKNHEAGVLVLCNIISAIPEITSPSVVIDYDLLGILENLYKNDLTPPAALLLRLAQDKFYSLGENEEYLFDCDKSTKHEINCLNKFLSGINKNKLNSLLYEELYDESDFVFFAVDYADSAEELETLLDSSNPTLILKVLNVLKDKQLLTDSHKKLALNNISNPSLKEIVEVL